MCICVSKKTWDLFKTYKVTVDVKRTQTRYDVRTTKNDDRIPRKPIERKKETAIKTTATL